MTSASTISISAAKAANHGNKAKAYHRAAAKEISVSENVASAAYQRQSAA